MVLLRLHFSHSPRTKTHLDYIVFNICACQLRFDLDLNSPSPTTVTKSHCNVTSHKKVSDARVYMFPPHCRGTYHLGVCGWSALRNCLAHTGGHACRMAVPAISINNDNNDVPSIALRTAPTHPQVAAPDPEDMLRTIQVLLLAGACGIAQLSS